MLKKRGKEVPENKDRGAKHAQVRFHIISIVIIIVSTPVLHSARGSAALQPAVCSLQLVSIVIVSIVIVGIVGVK